ncbi:unnamed protein product [Clonostachys rhizophaga]|uniref:Xylanolytic transcriptional activator regulatory domain-containing protein n=1 Tax=Clonostachys rhizophaga TaxID=160324 RepID=A0A9N9VBN5_9HYPO|nr:unnamed protein product [Clonostachys rhizophaga]
MTSVNEGFLSPKPSPPGEIPVVSAAPAVRSEPTQPTRHQPLSLSHARVIPLPAIGENRSLLEIGSNATSIPTLLVDDLLSQTQSPQDQVFIRGNGFLGAYNLTFFSDARLASLSSRLGNDSVNEVVGRISNVVRSRLSKRPESGQNPIQSAVSRNHSVELFTDRVAAKKYIQLYFERVHPLLPFLERASFESVALSNNLDEVLTNSKPWVCLYHAVLALGSQYDGEGSFEPCTGKAWKIFAVSLAYFPELLLHNDSLPTLEAMTAMSAFSLSVSCLAIEHVIISEAGRRAQNLAGANFTGRSAQRYSRCFWVLYAIEKMSSFQIGRSSVFVDGDISCPLPRVSEATFGGFDYLLSFLRYSRIISRALTFLFCVGVANKQTSYHLDTTEQLKKELEDWRLSLPDNGFRPGGTIRPETVQGPVERQAATFIHYLYAHMNLIINRNTLLHLVKSSDQAYSKERQAAASDIHKSCRLIVELTTLIEVEPHTNIWILATIPLAALFVLFDSVVHNPRQPETYSNLALLDMAAGHFSRLEYCSNGTLPGSLISEFSHVARTYVNGIQSRDSVPTGSHGNSVKDTSLLPGGSLQDKGSTNGVSPEITRTQPPAAQDLVMTTSGEQLRTVGEAGADFPESSESFEPFGGMDYSIDAFGGNISGEPSLGTNVLDLFNNFLPDLDPMLYHGMSGNFDLNMQLGGNDQMP